MPSARLRLTSGEFSPLITSCASKFLPANSGTNPAVKPTLAPATVPAPGITLPATAPTPAPTNAFLSDEPVPPIRPPKYSSPVLRSSTS